MFYQIPSWLYDLSLGYILVLVAYVFAFALIESLFLFGWVLIMDLIFPKKLFKDQFIAQGSVVVSVTCLVAVSVQRRLGKLAELQAWQTIAYPLIIVAGLFVLALVCGWLFNHFNRLGSLLSGLADRMTVFSYLYVPISAISLAVVLVRNLI
jgi:hypothetical protein